MQRNMRGQRLQCRHGRVLSFVVSGWMHGTDDQQLYRLQECDDRRQGVPEPLSDRQL